MVRFQGSKTSIPSDYIRKAVEEPVYSNNITNQKVVWLGKQPKAETIVKSKKGASWGVMSISFQTNKNNHAIQLEPVKGEWLLQMLPQLSIANPKLLTVAEIQKNYEAAGLEDFELFWDNKPVNTLYKVGLLRLK